MKNKKQRKREQNRRRGDPKPKPNKGPTKPKLSWCRCLSVSVSLSLSVYASLSIRFCLFCLYVSPISHTQHPSLYHHFRRKNRQSGLELGSEGCCLFCLSIYMSNLFRSHTQKIKQTLMVRVRVRVRRRVSNPGENRG